MKKLLFVLVATMLLGCNIDPVEKSYSGNAEIQLLFEKDGCKMYRFWDSRWVYWCNCQGSVSWKQSGKHRYESQTTITK